MQYDTICYHTEYDCDGTTVAYQFHALNDGDARKKAESVSKPNHELIVLYRSNNRGLYTTIYERKTNGT